MSSMSRRVGRRAAVLAGSVVLTLGCVLMAEGSSRYAALPEDVLAGSRGLDQDLFSGTFLYAELSQLTPCSTPGSICITCEEATYKDAGTTKGGGNDPGVQNQGNCGNKFSGVCATSGLGLVCIPSHQGGTEDPCTKPPGPLRKQQPE